MALIDAFLKKTVRIKPYVRDAGGEIIYGKEEQRKCRMQRGGNLRATYKNPDGQIDQVLANAKMFCTGKLIPTKSIVICDGKEYVVMRCDVATGFLDNHLEVYLE